MRAASDLMWIDNLETSSGSDLARPGHFDHRKDYVQDYLGEFGARKVEANALMARPDAARQLCRQYIPDEAVEEYEARLEEAREELAGRIAELRDGE